MNVIGNLGAAAIFFGLAFLRIFRPKQVREMAVIGRKRKWILIGNLMTVT